MKNKLFELGKGLYEIVKFVVVIIIIIFVLNFCDNKEDDREIGSLNVCGVELYIDDYYDNSIDWDSLGKDVDEECLQYYYENPKDICNNYIENNKEDICEE